MFEENTSQSKVSLVSVAELVDRTMSRFGRLFSDLFPWLIVFYFGGFLLTIINMRVFLPWQQIIIGLIGVLILLMSYLAEARIIAGVEKEPKDIVSNGRMVFSLFFPYIFLLFLQGFVSIGGMLFILPAIIFGIYLVVMPFVFVVEDKRGLSALTRSWGYIANRWWLTLWRMIVVLFLEAIVIAILGLVLNLGLGSSVSTGQPWVAALIQQLISSFIIVPLFLCYIFELYQDLRSTKPEPAINDEKTARMWLVIFLALGIILALVFAFGAVTHTAAHALGRI